MIPLLLLLSIGLVYGAESPRLSSSDKSPREHIIITKLKKQAQEEGSSSSSLPLNAQMVRASTVKQGPILGAIFYGATKAICYGAMWAGAHIAARKLLKADTSDKSSIVVECTSNQAMESMSNIVPKGAGLVATGFLATEAGREAAFHGSSHLAGAGMAAHGVTAMPAIVTTVNSGVELVANGAYALGCWIPWF
jgi:hypothetical protein